MPDIDVDFETISIHASAKEATGKNFTLEQISWISIHASAKEATHNMGMYFMIMMISIHASAKEATIIKVVLIYNYKFQSTPPRRRRHNTT